nr:peptidase dimerization domain-containing protein [Amycolatopsis sp. WAC 04169]
MTGRASHAGLEPESGVNALTEAAHQVLAIAALDRESRGAGRDPPATDARVGRRGPLRRRRAATARRRRGGRRRRE